MVASWQWRGERGRHQPQWRAKYELSAQSVDQYLASRPHCHSFQIHNCRASKGGMLRREPMVRPCSCPSFDWGSKESCSQRDNLSAATPMCLMNCKQEACATRNHETLMAGITTLSLHELRYMDTTSLMVDFFGMATQITVRDCLCSVIKHLFPKSSSICLSTKMGNRTWGEKTTGQPHLLAVLPIKIYPYSGHHHHHHHHATMFVGRLHV